MNFEAQELSVFKTWKDAIVPNGTIRAPRIASFRFEGVRTHFSRRVLYQHMVL